jgi:ribonuclease HI
MSTTEKSGTDAPNKTSDKIVIFTDGASRGNPGPGGWGTIVVEDRVRGRKVMELGGAEANTTNNRMELRSFIAGLNYLNTLNTDNTLVVVYTDSSYVLKGTLTWLPAWLTRGWKTATKKEVLNRDLWEDLSRAIRGRKITIKLLPGHVGIKGNERADEIATAYADGKPAKLFSGPLSEYGEDILDVSYDTAAKAARSDSKSRSRAKAYSYVSMVAGKIEIHKTWEECERRVKGTPGALFKKSLNAEEEADIIAIFKTRIRT